MQKWKQWAQQHPYVALFWLVFFTGAVLRLYDFNQWSLSNDELSALNRLRYDSFSELMQKGIRPDGHPAFTQVWLYYWTMLFGLQPFWVRLPFVLTGIASVYLTYTIGRRWFTEAAGLYASLFVAILPYTILYSQLARPYSPGLLFTLLTAFYWTLYFIENKKNTRVLAGFVLSSSLAMYTHYFSFMMAGMFIIAGLLFLKRDHIRAYAIAIACIVLLYLPFAGIFLHQLSIGGVGGEQGWLARPEWDWILDYVFFAFASSAVIVVILLAFVSILMLYYWKELRMDRIKALALAFFVIPFIVGFAYSRLGNPVLQYSVMLFAFPMLLWFMFSFFKGDKPALAAVVVVLSLASGSWVAVKGAPEYRNSQFADFESCANQWMEWSRKIPAEDITWTAAVNHPYYIEYYYINRGIKLPAIHILEGRNGKELADLAKLLRESRTPYFAYARTKPAPAEVPDVIAGAFPVLVGHFDYHKQSEVYLFARDTSVPSMPAAKPVKEYYCDFEQVDETFGVSEDKLDTVHCFSGHSSMLLTPETEWGPGIKVETGSAGLRFPSLVKVTVRFMADSLLTDSPVVLTITDRFGKDYVWVSGKLEYYGIPGEWTTAYLTAYLPHPTSINDPMKVFVWNKDRRYIWIDDFRIRFYKR